MNTIKLFTKSRMAGCARIRYSRRFHARSYLGSNSRPAVTTFSEEEELLRNSVARFSREVIAPKVKEMEENSKICPDIIKQCFEQGYMGIEIPTDLEGSGMSFVSSCIVIEELAKVDASISVMVDVHNTLVNTAIRKWGNE